MRTDAIAAVLSALFVCACAKSEAPEPNKNTNWLHACDDDGDCGDVAQACICNVCTWFCDGEPEEDSCDNGTGIASVCLRQRGDELGDQCTATSPTSAICVAACSDDGDCARFGEGSHCEAGACLAESNSYEEPGTGSNEDAGVPGDSDGGLWPAGCVLVGDECATALAEDQASPNAIIVQGDRVYWTNAGSGEAEDGSLLSMPVEGGEITTHAANLVGPHALALDATHAYWATATPAGQTLSSLMRVALAGGEPESFVGGLARVDAIAVDELSLYWLGLGTAADATTRALGRYAKADLMTMPSVTFTGDSADSKSLVAAGGAVYWKGSGYIFRATDDGMTVFDQYRMHDDLFGFSAGTDMLADSQNLYWLSDNSDRAFVARMSLSNPSDTTELFADLDGYMPTGFAMDESNLYWGYKLGISTDASLLSYALVRVDKVDGTAIELARSQNLADMQLAVSDDYVFIAVPGGAPGEGRILRFAKE